MIPAILLAAGLGTRLRPLTNSVPKCLAPVGNRPLLDIWLDNLTAAGIGPILVNTHYLADQVHYHLANSRHRAVVTLRHEPQLLGTAGTLLANRDFFGPETTLLIHADNFCMPDLAGFMCAHQQRPAHCLMTMMTFRSETPESCGIVELDSQHVVQNMYEKVAAPPGNLANAAVYCLSRFLLDRLTTDCPRVTDFSTEVIPPLLGNIYTFEEKGIFIDIGTPETCAQANAWAATHLTQYQPNYESAS